MTKLEFTGYAYEIVNREHAEQVARINAEQMLAVSELSFIGASPNKAIVLKDSPGNKIEAVWVTDKISVDIFEATINGTKIRYCSTGLIISPANPPEWVKDYVFGVNNPLEWYGEFKRTNYEQENIEFYTQKDLV